MNISSTGAMEIQPTHPKLVTSLTGRCMACMTVISVIVTITKAAWLALPHLPVQLTTQQQSRETLHFASLREWSDVGGGRAVLANLFP